METTPSRCHVACSFPIQNPMNHAFVVCHVACYHCIPVTFLILFTHICIPSHTNRYKYILITFVIHFGIVGTLSLSLSQSFSWINTWKYDPFFTTITWHPLAHMRLLAPFDCFTKKAVLLPQDSFSFCCESLCNNRDIRLSLWIGIVSIAPIWALNRCRVVSANGRWLIVYEELVRAFD